MAHPCFPCRERSSCKPRERHEEPTLERERESAPVLAERNRRKPHPSHNFGHGGVLQIRESNSDVGVVLLGQEQVPQTEGTSLGLERLNHGGVALPAELGVGGYLSMEDGFGGNAVLL